MLIDSEATLVAAEGAGLLADGTCLVAATGAGMVACMARNLPFRRLDEWAGPAEIAALGWRNYRELHAVLDDWDRWMQDRLPELDRRGIRPFRFSYHQLKIAVDGLSTWLLRLIRMLEAEAPARIAYAAGSPAVLDRLPAFNDTMNLAADVLESGVLGPQTAVHRLPAPPQPAVRGGWRQTASTLRRRLHGLLGLGRGAYLIFDTGHDIDALRPALAAAGLFPAVPAAAVRRRPRSEPWIDAFLARPDVRDLFSVDGHGYSDLMRRWFLEPLDRLLPEAAAGYDAVRRQMRGERIRFALTASTGLGLLPRSRMEAVRAAGRPLITFQEGAGYGSMITPIYDHHEVLDGDLMLTYGSGNAEYYAERDWPAKQMIAVGSPNQDRLRARLAAVEPAKRPFTVMYVGTAVDSNINHCPNNGLVDTYYLSRQIEIFDALVVLPKGIRVVARLHGADRAGRAWLDDPRYARIQVEPRRLDAVLTEADVFVIDFPSTVLLSCCLTDADLLVLAEPGVTGLTETQTRRLSTRAEVFTRLEDLTEAISGITAGRRRPDLRGDDYVRAYATHLHDGRSAERAVALLAEIADTGRLPLPTEEFVPA